MKTGTLLTIALVVALSVGCQQKYTPASYNKGINITPKPLELTIGNGTFSLNNQTTLVVDSTSQLQQIARFFALKLQKSTGYNLSIQASATKANFIQWSIDPSLTVNDEGYTLDATPQSISIKAKTAQGAYYGMLTLLQLLPAEVESSTLVSNIEWSLPAVSIIDEPRFSWRGYHLDVCRHFISLDEVKKHLDMLSIFKINKFHWHLTDDQGWRIEIKKHPKLISAGATRTEADGSTHSGYYTQEEIKEVVAYAAERYIDVIPEIEMPGHALAALSAYPELSCTGGPFTPRIIWGVETDVFCAGKDEVFTFLEEVLEEIIPLFPYDYVHMGGDESPKDRWKACPHCQARIKSENLHDEHELQSYFMTRMENVLKIQGKQMIGWDEILEGGISDSANIMSWRGEEGGIAAANAENDVVMAPGAWMYLDKYEGDYKIDPVSIGGHLPLSKIYGYEPIPAGIDSSKAHHILGAQTTMWGEYIYDETLTEYRMYPRAIALAELTWTAKANKDYADFERRINNQMVRMDGHDIEYYIPLPEGPTKQIAFLDSAVLTFTTPRPVDRMVYTLDGSEPTLKSKSYDTPLVLDTDGIVKIASVLAQGKMSRVRTIQVEKQTLAPAVAADQVKSGLVTKTAHGKFLNTESLNTASEWSENTIDSLSQANKTLYWGFVIDENRFRAEIIEGYIDIPEDGVYFFSSNQDQVWIDDALVVDNDGYVKRFSQNDGSKALAKGLHKLKVIYLNNVYRGWASDWNVVEVKIRNAKQEEFRSVTAEMLYRTETKTDKLLTSKQ
ncbi:family 20 glycosylhydrolase [Reichenbachiella carrageenanivorans]|uniref:beta-N-acetylhexosaminidase n=1 Tax=Reichenbachiella carrageenanivorans TaxID=2979869 RepID=A0ABY6CYX9_9BACT|nr:family 20 glycosylhydrolase [Reichenbachiella carrageenanivorans]UXX79122.1 family 20 glycosylhydrolase [Reichenbachiella carrageenanivorans]